MVTNILNDKKWSDNYVFSSAVFYAGNNNSYITYSDFENTKVIYRITGKDKWNIFMMLIFRRKI